MTKGLVGREHFPSRHRSLSPIVVEATACLTAEPSGFDIFREKGQGRYFKPARPSYSACMIDKAVSITYSRRLVRLRLMRVLKANRPPDKAEDKQAGQQRYDGDG
jgi:hypothetical protein